MSFDISRRSLMAGVPGALAAAGLSMPMPVLAAGGVTLDLNDPKIRASTRAKVIGSTVDQTIYKFFRLHIYGYLNDGNLVPFFTLNNLNISEWSPLPNGNFKSRTVECGVYCKFDTDEPLESWRNPVTGENLKPWQFVGGPFSVELGPDGVMTQGAELTPTVLRMEALGEMVFVPTAASNSWPNPMQPDVWPTQSSGKTSYWESHATFAGRTVDVVNPDLPSVKSFGHFQNMASWHPWLQMGNRPGRTYGKAHGTKFASLDDIPAAAMRGFEKHTPEIFDHKNWKKPYLDVPGWMAAHQPPK
jgi:hypothetical protein